MDDILMKRKEIFFNNLVLLGLDRVTFEKKHGITFNKDMFVLPNKKGYEIVSHFLFSKLTAVTGKDYDIPWPLLCKDHDRIFQKTCYSHLMTFSQESTVQFPRIVPSLLSTFGGDRFYEVYLAFSCYVLSKTIRKNGNINLLPRPSASQENFNTVKDILQLSTVLHMKKFKDTESVTHRNYLIWSQFAKNLEKSLQQLKHSLKINEDLIKEKKKTISLLYSTDPEEILKLQKIFEKNFQWLKPMLTRRKILNNFFATEERYWQHFSSEVEENAENEFLDGQDFCICVTKNLCLELEDVEYLSSTENRKLSVERFIKVFMAYLTYMTRLLKKVDLSELHKTCSVEDASSIESDLNSITSLNNKLTGEVIPDVEESIDKLKLVTDFDDQKDNLELSCNQFCSSLPVRNFKTEAIKERASHFDCSLERICQLPASEKQVCDEVFCDLDFVPKRNSLQLSFTKSVNQTLVPSDSSFPSTDVLSRRVTVASSHTSNVVNEMASSSIKETVPCTDHSLCSEFNILSLGDIDFVSSSARQPSTFKMRKSWLHEESLNSMTLPDLSFDEL